MAHSDEAGVGLRRAMRVAAADENFSVDGTQNSALVTQLCRQLLRRFGADANQIK